MHTSLSFASRILASTVMATCFFRPVSALGQPPLPTGSDVLELIQEYALLRPQLLTDPKSLEHLRDVAALRLNHFRSTRERIEFLRLEMEREAEALHDRAQSSLNQSENEEVGLIQDLGTLEVLYRNAILEKQRVEWELATANSDAKQTQDDTPVHASKLAAAKATFEASQKQIDYSRIKLKQMEELYKKGQAGHLSVEEASSQVAAVVAQSLKEQAELVGLQQQLEAPTRLLESLRERKATLVSQLESMAKHRKLLLVTQRLEAQAFELKKRSDALMQKLADHQVKETESEVALAWLEESLKKANSSENNSKAGE